MEVNEHMTSQLSQLLTTAVCGGAVGITHWSDLPLGLVLQLQLGIGRSDQWAICGTNGRSDQCHDPGAVVPQYDHECWHPRSFAPFRQRHGLMSNVGQNK